MLNAYRIVVAISVLIPLAACAAFPTPTPMPFPSSELFETWRLIGVVTNGEIEPPFAEGLRISIKPTREITWNDGCNSATFGPFVSDSDPSLRLLSKTMLACFVEDSETGELKAYAIPGYDQLEQVMRSVVAYEFRKKELWLYYPESKSNALVFR